MLVLLTGDYDEFQYESWRAVHEQLKKDLDKSKHKWTAKV
jgi:hypothetical protein